MLRARHRVVCVTKLYVKEMCVCVKELCVCVTKLGVTKLRVTMVCARERFDNCVCVRSMCDNGVCVCENSCVYVCV